MTREQFNEAMELILPYHSTRISVNLPENDYIGTIGTTRFRLHITRCVPLVIQRLAGAGFILSMTAEGLEVDKT